MKALTLFFSIISIAFFQQCTGPAGETKTLDESSEYLDNSNRDDKFSGGVKMVKINTPSGEFNVWTKRVGNNPQIKLLLLHGGPGGTHEYFECFDSFLPMAGVEYYYYDQLESKYSDQPNDTSLWNIEHYVEEVEQVRKALKLDKNNFFLLGHSWGGMLAIEYALKYQENLKGLIISNMMASIPDYVAYANEVLAPGLPDDVLLRIRDLESQNEYLSTEYLELVAEHYYPKHVLRMPIDNWPEPVNRAFENTNSALYVAMQGPSEFGVVGDVRLKNWDRKPDLNKIRVPTLSIGGAFDTMDPEHMKWIATEVQNGKYLYCPNGSHMAMYDDQEIYIKGLVNFMKAADRN